MHNSFSLYIAEIDIINNCVLHITNMSEIALSTSIHGCNCNKLQILLFHNDCY